MVRKVIGYLLLSCFFNVLTTLPAKCCEKDVFIHQHNSKSPVHSFTILQHLLDLMDDDSAPDETDIDVHCSVYNETARPASIQAVQCIGEPGIPSLPEPAVTAVYSHATSNARQFPTPQHHNFLFRLTPF